MFKIHKEELEVNGKKLTLETGKVARQADGAIIASLGETIVIAMNKRDMSYFEFKSSLFL
mgnify:CR=1 FL=1